MTENWQNLAQRLGGEPALQASRTLWLSDQLGWLAVAQYLRTTAHEKELEKLFDQIDIWTDITTACTAMLCLEGIVFLCEKPLVCRLNQMRRLHCADGPALTYSDGFAQYVWNGVVVPRQIIESPQSITVQQIEDETNAEIRRVMLERFGEARFFQESGMVPIHEDNFGTLYRKEFPNDEPLVMVKVLNATPEPDGTVKNYYLRVPPNMTTAQQAVAWTFGFERGFQEYDPLVQT
jgi:hypothetical protein